MRAFGVECMDMGSDLVVLREEREGGREEGREGEKEGGREREGERGREGRR